MNNDRKSRISTKDDFQAFLDKQLEDENFRREWETLQPEFAIIQAVIDAYYEQGLNKNELSRRSGIPLREISKLENGNANPSVRTLQRLAEAMGKKLKIEFV